MILVVGSGLAGLSAALKLAKDTDVVVICKDRLDEGATRYAQGGIASVFSKDDRFEDHLEDTMVAGAGLCRREIVELCVREGPERVRELIELGVKFTKAREGDPAEAFDLHREGGHRKRRILHADDLTGLAIQETMIRKVAENPRIKVLEHHTAIDLITEFKTVKATTKPNRCLGAYALDQASGVVKTIESSVTILATGGAGKAYLYTSNPDVATGDGIAMASRAGARVANLEFMQFHPTCLFHPGVKTFLISEALRGEGAVLRNACREEFMPRYHELGSLAPRDVVARAIDQEMKRSGARHLWLDATALDSDSIRKGFPNIFENCQKYGIDITKDLIPVVPAAHYTCGGVLVGTEGETSIPGLYAIGEVSCSGLHGANRLASNSLLEAVVFADRAVRHALKEGSARIPERTRSSETNPLPEWDTGLAVRQEEQIDIAAIWHEVRSLMWNYVGIVRSNRRLERAKRRLDLIKKDVEKDYWAFLPTRDLIELRNLVTVAELIVQCALHRKESRGLHYNVDFPARNDALYGRDTVF